MQQEARRRAPAAARRERLRLVALTGTTAYLIAVFSYTDNRSSTYLLAYTTLPLLLTAAPWQSSFRLRPIFVDQQGFVVAQLVAR